MRETIEDVSRQNSEDFSTPREKINLATKISNRRIPEDALSDELKKLDIRDEMCRTAMNVFNGKVTVVGELISIGNKNLLEFLKEW